MDIPKETSLTATVQQETPLTIPKPEKQDNDTESFAMIMVKPDGIAAGYDTLLQEIINLKSPPANPSDNIHTRASRIKELTSPASHLILDNMTDEAVVGITKVEPVLISRRDISKTPEADQINEVFYQSHRQHLHRKPTYEPMREYLRGEVMIVVLRYPGPTNELYNIVGQLKGKNTIVSRTGNTEDVPVVLRQGYGLRGTLLEPIPDSKTLLDGPSTHLENVQSSTLLLNKIIYNIAHSTEDPSETWEALVALTQKYVPHEKILQIAKSSSPNQAVARLLSELKQTGFT